MYVCILDQAGETLWHRHMPATPEALLKAIAPDREQIVMAAECLLTWYGLADLGADQGLPCVLGHALSMPAIHGGTATHDTIDAQKSAVLLRGGMLPQADVSPAERRATRDLRRRRMHLARHRGALLAHGQHTNSPYTLPAIGHQIAYKTTRDVERALVNTAKHHDAHTLYLRQTVPGIGKILSLVRLSAIPQSDRVPRGQDVASSCRLVQGAKASAGTRAGTSGTNSGPAHLQWAFSDAAV